MPLERIGPSVAFDGRPVSVPSASHVYSSATVPTRPGRRPSSMDAASPSPPSFASRPPLPVAATSLTRSGSSGSAYSLRSFGGRTSDILAPLEPSAPDSAPPSTQSATSASASASSVPKPPEDRCLPSSAPAHAPLIGRVVSSIGNPRSRQGNVDLLDAGPSSSQPLHPLSPDRLSVLGRKAFGQPRTAILTAPPGMVPSPPSLSPPPSPPLPPAAPAPSPITAPLRQMGRRAPNLHAVGSATGTEPTRSTESGPILMTTSTAKSLAAKAGPPPKRPWRPDVQSILPDAPATSSTSASTSFTRKRLPSEPLLHMLPSPPHTIGRGTRASVSASTEAHPLSGLPPEASPVYRRRHSGRFLSRNLSQTLLRAPRFPVPRDRQSSLGAIPPISTERADAQFDFQPRSATSNEPTTPEDVPNDLLNDGPDEHPSAWGHVVPSLGASLAAHPLSALSTPSESPTSQANSLSHDHVDQNEPVPNPTLCIDSLIARLQAAVAAGGEDPAVSHSSPPARRGGQGLVLRTPTTSELSLFLARQTTGAPLAPPSAPSASGAGGIKKEGSSLAKVEEEEDGKPNLASWRPSQPPTGPNGVRTLVPPGHEPRAASPIPGLPPDSEVVPFVAKPPGEKRGIGDYHVLKEIGRGAYGVVQVARLKDPWRGQANLEAGNKVGETVVIKYIVKSRILADCWRRHRTLGTIPTEIHVMDQLRRLPYHPPRTWPPWSPEILLPQQFPEKLDPEVSLSRAQGLQPGMPLYHPNLVHMLDFFEDAEYYYLVMRRFGQGQDVFDFVEGSAGGVELVQVRCIAGQLAYALVFLHEHGIVHRDIKDENVILDGPGLHAQLIDFGSAAHRSKSVRKRFDTFSGTLEYAAAEILRGESYEGPAQDIWALGVVLYVLLCGECPFWNGEEALGALQDPDSRPAQTLRKRLALGDIAPWANSSTPTPGLDQGQADGGGTVTDAVELIMLCLSLHPLDRPTARQVCTHRFFAGRQGWSGAKGWLKLDANWGEEWLGPMPSDGV